MPDRPVVDVVGLGPAGPELVTEQTRRLIDETADRFARTSRHPADPVLGDHVTLDDVYEEADRIEEVYPAIVARLADAAHDRGRILYAVPGSPVVAERSVELLVQRTDLQVRLHPALSFADLAWVRLGVDPVQLGARLVDGHRFASEAAGERGPLLVTQCDRRSVLSDVKLALDDPPEQVTILHHLGLSDERIEQVEWADLDRLIEPDHLTSLWIAELASPVGRELVAFDELVSVLRQRCPWDADQTHASLRRHLLEETYELLEVLDELASDPTVQADELDDALCEELGDVLFQVFFHARIAAEDGRFDIADVARGIHDKLHSRHPHVFGDTEVTDPAQLVVSWEAAKRLEKGRESVMDGIAPGLPALAYASKVLGRVPGGITGAGVATTPTQHDRGDLASAVLDLVARARRDDIDLESEVRASAAAIEKQVRATEVH